MQEKETVRKLKHGDQEAFAFLYNHYWKQVYNFTRLYFTASMDIEEIVQEVFVKVWESHHFLDENKSFEGSFSHAQTVTLVPVNPAEFLTTVLSCQKNTLDYLGIRLEIHVEHTSSPVFLDRIKMRQVIFNLIKNSCEAIDQPGGKIIVNLTPADSGICICIKDNGCGMTHKQTENIFHPFITYKPEGTGLGLAVTAEIISAHHGQIRVSSTPGQGSAFYIYLPASPE